MYEQMNSKIFFLRIIFPHSVQEPTVFRSKVGWQTATDGQQLWNVGFQWIGLWHAMVETQH